MVTELRRFEGSGAVLLLERVKMPGHLPRYVVTVEVADDYRVVWDDYGRARAENVWWQQRDALKDF